MYFQVTKEIEVVVDKSSLYEIASARVQARNQRRMLWYINLAGFLIFIGLLILLTGTPFVLPAVFVLMVWIGMFVLHTFIVEHQESREKDIEAEIAHLQIERRDDDKRTEFAQLPETFSESVETNGIDHDWWTLDPLSARELEVLALLATGASNSQIAQQLVIAPNTVKRHVKHILAKLQATNRTQAVHHARELQLL
jgi:DNA-binding CsgD family transcriptional regulator